MSTALIARRKKDQNTKGREIAKQIMEAYQLQSREEMQDALKDIFGPMFEAILQGEMDSHLGYKNNDHDYKETTDCRNGYSQKTLKTSMGEVPINVPRDRDASFDPQLPQSDQ